MNNSINVNPSSEVAITLDGLCILNGAAGLIVLADGTCLQPMSIADVRQSRDVGETMCGSIDRLHLASPDHDPINVNMVFNLYRDTPILEVEMTVTNVSPHDLLLDRIILFRGLPPHEGFHHNFLCQSSSRFLNQPFHWPGHFDVRNYLQAVPADGAETAHWSTAIGEHGKTSMAIGIGEAARGGAEISFIGNDGLIGLEIASSLRTDLHGRPFRLCTGMSYTAHRMVLALGADPVSALDLYTEFVCQRLNWQLRFPPYSGLFTAYGNDPTNADPANMSLSEERLAILMQVVEERLRPYGLDTIKTQFHGNSSSRPGNGPVKQLTAAEIKEPGRVKTLIDSIREKAFAPDNYDSRQDFPHGISWHVHQLAAQGYRPALVCRPFYNIEGGTPELDAAAADLFEMTVKEWGYRYLMFDFIDMDYASSIDTLTIEQGIYNRFKAIRDRVGDDIFIEACMVWPGPVLGVADGYRPAHDWRGGLEEDLAPTFACRYHYHDRFFQCDNEFSDPAQYPFTWRASGVEHMASTQQRVRLWVSYNAMLGFSYLGGAALERVEADRWWIFQRGLPAQGGRATPVDLFEASPPQRWKRNCRTPSGEYYLLGQFNWDKSQAYDAPVCAADWDISENADYLWFDFWSGQVSGPAHSLPGWLAPFSCRMLQLYPVPTHPSLVGNTRHVTGQVGIDRWQFSPQDNTLEGDFSGAPGSRENYWIWLPGNEGLTTCSGVTIEYIRPHVLRLSVSFDTSGHQAWRLVLDSTIPVL